ncbi:3496_t:CDS:1, partial [Cetraspora pellucida]
KAYNTLKITMSQFLNDLWSIKKDGMLIANIHWKFQLYFSFDWKFLAICLGLNTANSLHFCPWCLCSKQQHGDLSKDW